MGMCMYSMCRYVYVSVLIFGVRVNPLTCVYVGIINGFCQHTHFLFSSSIMCAMNTLYNSTAGKYHSTHFH